MLESLFDDVLKKLPSFNVEDYDLDLDYPHDEIIEIDPAIFESTELVPMPGDQDYDPEFSDMDEKEIGVVEGGVRAGGIEILAFYKSYRHMNELPFRGEWGIFYINRGVQYIDQMLTLAFPGVENCRKIDKQDGVIEGINARSELFYMVSLGRMPSSFSAEMNEFARMSLQSP